MNISSRCSPWMEEWINTSENDGRRVWIKKKRKEKKDERIPHVTARHKPPQTWRCELQWGRGRVRPTNHHSMRFCLWPAPGHHVLPAEAPALPASEARRQTPCMPAWHSWGTRRARWGKGREAAGRRGRWGMEDRVGSCGKLKRWEEDRQTERDGGEDRLW